MRKTSSSANQGLCLHFLSTLVEDAARKFELFYFPVFFFCDLVGSCAICFHVLRLDFHDRCVLARVRGEGGDFEVPGRMIISSTGVLAFVCFVGIGLFLLVVGGEWFLLPSVLAGLRQLDFRAPRKVPIREGMPWALFTRVLRPRCSLEQAGAW